MSKSDFSVLAGCSPKSAMRIVKDDAVTTSYGFYECPACKAEFYGGGPALHESNCPDKSWGYTCCVYHVGPKCPEYDEALE